MVLKRDIYRNSMLILLLIVLGSNISLYHTTFGINILPDNPNGVVVGSMLDLALISPILYLGWRQNWSWKNVITAIAGGLVLIRFLIPMTYLAPFEIATWAGFAVEGSIILFEILILTKLVKYLPIIVRSVKESHLPVVFSFSSAVDNHIKPNPIIRIICSEMLMFYYAFASWKKKSQKNNNMFTLHQKSSLIAFQIMMIHAIILETLGIHFWLHEKSFILSLIILIFNIYSAIFFVGDLQAVRHNPLLVTGECMYLSLGLMKRMKVNWSDINVIIDEPKLLTQKRSKDTIEFIAWDFEAIHPNIILKLKHPIKATLLMGINKEYEQVAIRVDEPNRFKDMVKEQVKYVGEKIE
ncbi:beta-carotene 15,15'-monooxygenase [Bacillus benzoevorans]|uniref:Beta-carotene 15,15'-monooxygenase n=2 Tax=Bacillus benzoevorans TaxID=1456 RepID=A0A7X0LXB6_9BACI|nr:hypothetical protein [Bacillus benzoevorans]